MISNERAASALSRVREGLSPQAQPGAEHALALALETMFRTGDDRCLLSTTEVERYIGNGHNGSRVIRRLFDCGALDDITNEQAGESFRGLFTPGRIWSNTTTVQLPHVVIEGQSRSVPIEGQSDAAGHGSPEGVAVEGQMLSNSLTYVGKSNSNNVRNYVAGMEPRSPIWKGNPLGSREARVYGVVVSAGTPVTASVVSSALGGLGNRGAKDILRNLGRHRLIKRTADDSGWIPGPITPATHDPATCEACPPTPALVPTPALPTPVRPSQPQERPMSELFPCPCGEWRYPEDDCPGCGHSEHRPASTHSDNPRPVPAPWSEPKVSLPEHPSITCFSLDGAVITERRDIDSFLIFHHGNGRAQRFSHTGRPMGSYYPGESRYPDFLYEYLT